RQRRFAGDASHQPRTPPAALLGQVQLARRRERTPQGYRRTLDLVHEERVRLRQIVETLLLLAQPAERPPETPPIELDDELTEHLARWSSDPRSGDLRAVFDRGAELRVRAHPTLLAQFLDNLLENAAKYSTPGTPIVVGVRRRHKSILVTVEDRGCGLSPED